MSGSADPATRWLPVDGRVVHGHGVASGRAGDARFPGGTIAMQRPALAARGVDLSAYHAGTVNVAVGPRRVRLVAPRVTLRRVRWHPTEPPEDFSLADVRLDRPAGPVPGLVYCPHPDTKPAHVQLPDVVELLLPFVPDLTVGESVRLWLPADQAAVDRR